MITNAAGLKMKERLSWNVPRLAPALFSKKAIRVAISFLAGGALCEGIPLLTLLGNHPLPWLVNWGIGTPLAWMLATLVFALYSWQTIRVSSLIQAWWLRWHWLRLVALPAALITGFFEEALFRKFLMDFVARMTANTTGGLALQVLASALVFGGCHALWGLARGSLRNALWAALYTTVLGGALAVVYLVGGRALAPSIAAHIAINLVCEPWMILSAATGSWHKQLLTVGESQ
jgi:membrane protease YdiL (CAAX protease family)